MQIKTKRSIALLLILIGSVTVFQYYLKIYNKNVLKDAYLYIPSNTTEISLLKIISPFIESTANFKWVAKQKNYLKNIKSGKYFIKKGMNSNELVNLLRSGKQTPIKLTFNNQDCLESLAGRISEQIETDSTTLLKAFKDPSFLEKNGFTQATAIGMYIPNTYEIYWNTSANTLRNRLLKEYANFWNATRISKAQKQNLSIDEVIVMASIVQKETSYVQERPTVAGLYLNRYHKKWPLQADPTIIYILKKKYAQNNVIKRVLNKDLKINSPYNTYKHIGLPPGPISMPDISSIDAVLNPAKHNYFYMCANVEKIGTHSFSKSLIQHNKNARKYQKWLSSQDVKR